MGVQLSAKCLAPFRQGRKAGRGNGIKLFSLPGKFTKRGIDLRVFHGDTEFAVQRFELDTGFGLVYAADRIPMLSSWIEPDTSVHLRQPWSWGESWRGTWLLRWREPRQELGIQDR